MPAPSSGVLAGRKLQLLCAASPEPSPEHPLWVPLHQCRTQGLAVNPLRDGGMVWELGTAEGVILCFVFSAVRVLSPTAPTWRAQQQALRGGLAPDDHEHPQLSSLWQQSWPCELQQSREQIFGLAWNIFKQDFCLDLKIHFSVQILTFFPKEK